MLWIILFVLWCYYLVRWKYFAFNFYVEVSVFWSETSGFKKWTLKSHKRSKHSNISQTCRVTIIVFFLSTGAGTTNIVSVLKKNELGRAAAYSYFRSLSYYQLSNFNFSVGPWKHAWHNKCWGRQNYTIKQEMTQNCRYGLRAAIGTAMWNILCCWTLLHDLSINGNIMKNVFYFGEGVRWHGTQRRCLFNCDVDDVLSSSSVSVWANQTADSVKIILCHIAPRQSCDSLRGNKTESSLRLKSSMWLFPPQSSSGEVLFNSAVRKRQCSDINIIIIFHIIFPVIQPPAWRGGSRDIVLSPHQHTNTCKDAASVY